MSQSKRWIKLRTCLNLKTILTSNLTRIAWHAAQDAGRIWKLPQRRRASLLARFKTNFRFHMCVR